MFHQPFSEKKKKQNQNKKHGYSSKITEILALLPEVQSRGRLFEAWLALTVGYKRYLNL